MIITAKISKEEVFAEYKKKLEHRGFKVLKVDFYYTGQYDNTEADGIEAEVAMEIGSESGGSTDDAAAAMTRHIIRSSQG